MKLGNRTFISVGNNSSALGSTMHNTGSGLNDQSQTPMLGYSTVSMLDINSEEIQRELYPRS